MKRTLLFISTALFISIAIAVIAAGCSRISRNPDLLRADALTDTDPHAALRLLDSLPYDGLSEADRHFHDLVSVKATDKAYITHTSDSLILDAAAYFKGTDRQPEALYYAGRVYSDLGDYPTALRYFQDALEQLPEDNLMLKSNLTSQTGQLLYKMRLYDQAIPYIQKTISINKTLNDSANLPFNNQLLGRTYLQINQHGNALKYLTKALSLSKNAQDSALMKAHIADIYNRIGQTDSALKYIRTTPLSAHSLDRNYIYAIAAKVYLQANNPDSAKKYADKLIGEPTYSNATTGYLTLLNPKLSHLINPDSINSFLNKYVTLSERKYDLQNSQSVIVQNALYNYSIHEREAQRKSELSKRLQSWLVIVIIVILFLSVVILCLKHKNAKTIIRLQASLRELDRLVATKNDVSTKIEVNTDQAEIGIDGLQQQISDRLSLIESNPDNLPALKESVVLSRPYKELTELVEQKASLPASNPLYGELWDVIDHAYPKFRITLQRFSGGSLKKADLDLALLIKLEITPLQCSNLFCKSPGAITYRRKQLLSKIAPGQKSVDRLDYVIRAI